MNCKKPIMRVLTALMCFAMLISAFTVAASAVDPKVTLEVGDVKTSSAAVGGFYTVEVPINITQNDGFVSLLFNVVIPEGVSLTAIADGAVFTDYDAVDNTQAVTGEVTGKHTFFYIDPLAKKDYTATGVLAKLTLKIPEAKLANGGSVEISIEGIEAMSQGDESATNENEVRVSDPVVRNFFAEPGLVSLQTEVLGDINLDGIKNTTDAIDLYRWVLAVYSSEYSGSRDFNNDGSINTIDAIYLYRNVLGLVDLFPNS